MNVPCAFHDQSMEQLRATLLDIKDQMRAGIEVLNKQAEAFAQTIARIVESQSERRALCAKQEQRITNLEQSQIQHRAQHATEREEYLEDRADMWAAINKLRFHVYVGLGAAIVLQILAPFIIRAVFKG